MINKISKPWHNFLKPEIEKEYFQNLTEFITNEYRTGIIYPPKDNIFRAFELCKFGQLKVIILGQDPYHNENQANGLSFSVSDETKQPPSLRNIFKEINQDLGIPIPESGNLDRWARQGILMLNAILTVRAHQPGSHQKKGWERFTDAVIEMISNYKTQLVFILWGNFAISKCNLINESKHLVLKAPHPSPFSAYHGFFGCKHFSQTNAYLKKNKKKEIVW